MSDARIRLYLEHPLAGGQSIALNRDQAHYLFGVMRRKTGDPVLVFNSVDGEWRAEVTEAGKRSGRLSVVAQTRPLRVPPDLWLLFAPIKKARTDFIVEKATELGVARIMPVMTRFTNAERVRRDRLQLHAIEAAEQCGGTFVPPVEELVPLDKLISAWPSERNLIFFDEERADAGASASADAALGALPAAPAAILIGPEGGFSDEERSRLSAMPQVTVAGLGPRVLRADTAAVAAISLWQSRVGDW